MKAADDLRGRIGEIEGRKLELGGERDEIAYKAHVERDAKAAKRLAEINVEFVHLDNEIASLNAALAEAGRRAEAATAAERAEAERQRAEKAAPLVQRLEALGATMDQATATYVAGFREIEKLFNELERLGVPTPSRALVSVNMNKAHDSALTPMGDK